jgi:glycerophosphoryl diester phosphodiesterase
MGHAPENTLASIRAALDLGAPCIEIDVYQVDGRLVVFHDDRLERTTNGKGYLVEQSFDYLRTLDAGDGQRIPTLEEACSEIGSRAGLNIELKGPETASPVAELIARLTASGWERERFLVSSFNCRELVEIKRIDRHIKRGLLLFGQPADGIRRAVDLEAFSVHPSLEAVNRAFVTAAHASGLQVYVYTVNQPQDIMRMHRIGADGVFTNFPDRVIDRFEQGDQAAKWIPLKKLGTSA